MKVVLINPGANELGSWLLFIGLATGLCIVYYRTTTIVYKHKLIAKPTPPTKITNQYYSSLHNKFYTL